MTDFSRSYYEIDLFTLQAHATAIGNIASSIGVPAEYIVGGIVREITISHTRLYVANPWNYSSLPAALAGLSHSEISAMFEQDNLTLSREEIKSANGDGGAIIFRSIHPLFWSNGIGFIKGFSAIEELRSYNQRHPSDDPLLLKKYNEHYDLLLQDLNDGSKDTVFRVSAATTESATAFYQAFMGQAWEVLTDAQRAALVTKYYAVGRCTLEDQVSLDGDYTPWFGGEGSDVYLFGSNAANISRALSNRYVQCFSEGTPVAVPKGGSKAIKDLSFDDIILSFVPAANRGRGALVPARVARVFRGTTTERIELEGVGEGVTRVTPGHRYLRPDGTFAEIQHILATDGLVIDGSEAGTANATQFGVGISTFIGGYIARQIVAANDNSRNIEKAA